ncbi:MAG: radical SAM protein [Syntrophaceae bacterium]|nr:radical SAM protein [Syntrophaceae bacterium]
MSRILLIKPNIASAPRVIPANNPPMGLMYLASYLRSLDPDRNIRIIDMALEELTPDDLLPILKEFQPDICGISCLTMNAKNSLRISELIKKWNPKCYVTLGGPHPTLMPDKALDSQFVDCCVVGEGEETTHRLISALENNKPYESIDGISYRDGKNTVMNKRPPSLDIKHLPWPAYDLIPVKKYFKSKIPPHSGRVKYSEYMTVMSSRACPYGCIYCHNIFGKEFRAREPEEFVEEMVMLKKDYGVKEFHMIDDVFNLQRERVLKICELIRQKLPGIAIAFPNGLRTDLLDKDTLSALKQSGMYYFAAGIESGSPEIQKVIKKNLNHAKALQAIEDAARMGIIVHGFFMMGFPGETEEQINMTIDFARKSSLNTAGFFAVTAYPETELYEMAKQIGVALPDNFDTYHYHHNTLNLTNMSLSRLQSLRKKAYWNFYCHPERIYKIISMTPRKTDILTNLKMHFRDFF